MLERRAACNLTIGVEKRLTSGRTAIRSVERIRHMTLDQLTRQQLSELLKTGNAHLSFEDAVADFPIDKINHQPANVPYSFWHLVEHLRITQRDILDYLNDANYEEMHWPKDYWPAPDATTDQSGWDASIAAFIADRDALVAIIENPATDLTTGVPSNPDHSILREMLIVADHNAYHIGELAILRQVDSAWGSSHQE